MKHILYYFAFFYSLMVYTQNQLTPEQWQEDVLFLKKTVHKDFPFLFKKITSISFDNAVDELHKAIPSLEDHEVRVGLGKLVSMFQYGHTQIPLSTIAKAGILPINFYHFSNGVYIEGAHKDHKEVLGAKVITIENTPVERALELIYPVVPVENDWYFKAYGIRFLGAPEILHAQGVIDALKDTVELTLEKEGSTFTYDFPIIAYKEKPKHFDFTVPTDNWLTVRNVDVTPLYLKYYDDKNYFFEYLEDSRTLYVRQSSVFNDDNETLKAFYERLFNFIDNNTIDRLVYDVRLNGGGNNYNNLPLIKGLMARPKINTRGKFFYIIGRNTFSACQNLTNEITRYTEAILVGEPTSENVNFYGDAKPVQLPNSGITAYLSYAWWQDMPQWENKDATLPHIAVEMSLDDYVNNRDAVLEKALNYSDTGFILNPLQHLTELFMEGKFEQIRKDAAVIAKDKAYKYYDFEEEFSNTAGRLQQTGQTQGAIFVLQLLTELYPESVAHIFNLGGAYERIGEIDKAIESYKSLLKEFPNHSLADSARNRIKSLRN